LNRPIVVLGGPTAGGKSRIALELSVHFPCEIVNADSRQIYRELEIGTGQPSVKDLQRVPHHLFGFLNPSRQFSVSAYESEAVPIVDQILRQSAVPVLVGGTGFYIRALLKGTWPVPPADQNLRKRLKVIEFRRGRSFLHRLLKRLDSAPASKIAANDSYRVIRALEIRIQTGEKSPDLVLSKPDRYKTARFFVYSPREQLQKNIRRRIDEMFAKGWVEEVRALLTKYPNFVAFPAAASIGYREIVRLLNGEIDLESCKEIIFHRTSRYAKIQLTWFRNQDSFLPLSGPQDLYKIVDSVLQLRGDS